MKRLAVLSLALAFLTLLPGTAQAASAGWISSTCYTHSRQADPIVSPGVYPSDHLHDFVGANLVDENSTPDTVRAGGSCTGTPGDTVAEWVPALTTSTHGTIVPSAGQNRDILTYYRNPSGIRNVQPFPDGFGLVLGNAHATSAAELDPHIYFKCGPGGGSHYAAPPATCPSGHYLTLVFTFPQFWTGNMVAGNNISEMSYVRDAGHPMILPRLQIFVRYSQATGNVGTVSLASGPWYTAHIDYWNTWESAAFNSLLARCLNGGVDCGKDPIP